MKFETGNKVKVTGNKRHGHPIGTIGIIKDLQKSPSKYVLVEDMNKTYSLWHEEDELEFYEEKPEHVPEITFDQFKKHILKKSKNIMKQEIKVGDTIEIIKSRLIYTTYDKMFRKVGFKDTEKNDLGNSFIGIVFSIDKHFESDEMLCSLNMEDGKQILIQLKGVKKIKEGTMKNLLETAFVIENCKLPQRLAIKAYCDEKKIKYFKRSFETINGEHLAFDDKVDGFVGTVELGKRDKITFSELIQFLNQYQPEPEPELKVGDFRVQKESQSFSFIPDITTIVKLEDNQVYTQDENNTTSWLSYKDHLRYFRHATPEEIKKWKEENEIKLPKIADYEGQAGNIGYLKWGCTEISITTIKELLELNTRGLTIKTLHISESEIKQIKKFIEYHKL